MPKDVATAFAVIETLPAASGQMAGKATLPH